LLGQNTYGLSLKYGAGVNEDLNEAAHYFKMSADQGNAFGQMVFGFCVEAGEGVKQNVSEAVKYYRAVRSRHPYSESS
jgi:hypothetical protein